MTTDASQRDAGGLREMDMDVNKVIESIRHCDGGQNVELGFVSDIFVTTTGLKKLVVQIDRLKAEVERLQINRDTALKWLNDGAVKRNIHRMGLIGIQCIENAKEALASVEGGENEDEAIQD